MRRLLSCARRARRPPPTMFMDMFSPPRRAPKDEAEAKSVPVLVDITATSATADEEEGSPQVLDAVYETSTSCGCRQNGTVSASPE